MRRRLQALMGQGYEHVYLYPGLRKVIQAAGRVIRTPTDRGVLWLLDERYAQAQVRQLLPPGWQVQLIAGRDDPAMAATRPADPAPTPAH
jgi:DNA excision repair protein ERCC-2